MSTLPEIEKMDFSLSAEFILWTNIWSKHHKRLFGLPGSAKTKMPRRTTTLYFFSSLQILIDGGVMFVSFHFIVDL
jgi:hypothetical protein